MKLLPSNTTYSGQFLWFLLNATEPCTSIESLQTYDAVKVHPIDTTAAGDTFIGALAAMLVQGHDMGKAVRHAIHAAAMCVTRPGAQASMPSRAEVERFTHDIGA